MSPGHHPRTSIIVSTPSADKTLAATLDRFLARSDAEWEALIIGSLDHSMIA